VTHRLLVAIVATTLVVIAGIATQACAGSDGPDAADGQDAANGLGTYDWVLTEAYRLAAERGADWPALDDALFATDHPDAAPEDLASRAADAPRSTFGSAAGRITYLYQGALADLAAGDSAAAGIKVALLSRAYTDLCSPLHGARSSGEGAVQRAYEAAVERLVGSTSEDASWLASDSHTQVTDVHALARSAGSSAKRSYSALQSSFGSGEFGQVARTTARLSLGRAVHDLADIITTLRTARLEDARSFGAVGDGVTDDTAALTAAMGAAADAGTGLHVPAGTYKVSTISVPDGILLQGAGRSGTWIKGAVLFGSRDLITGLRLGDVEARTHNQADAADTTFEDCRFRGTVPIKLGDDHSCSHIAFRDCQVERSFGPWTPTASYNNIIIEEYSPGPHGHVEHITFERCHVGVSNGSGGRDTGSPSAGLVAYCNPETPILQGYRDIRIIDCVFEATDEFTLDFDDKVKADGTHSSRDVLVQGCVVKGAGVEGLRRFAYSICIESPEGVIVRDNLIYRGYINTFKMTKNEDPDPDRRPLIVEGNTFDLTVDNGVDTPEGVSMIRLHGDNTIFRDNTIITDLRDDVEAGDAPGAIFKLYQCRGSRITGNKVYDRATERNPLLFHLYTARDNTISSNYFWSSSAESLGISSQAGSGANVFTGNTFDH
jgi:hypothetical protein